MVIRMPDHVLHRGDDGRVHYARRHDPEMRWLCGAAGGSVQREDLDAPACEACLLLIDGLGGET